MFKCSICKKKTMNRISSSLVGDVRGECYTKEIKKLKGKKK